MAPKATAKKPRPAARSLADFLLEKKRASCPVCALAPEIRVQVDAARRRGVRRAEWLEWLRDECGVVLQPGDFDQHINGRHEVAA